MSDTKKILNSKVEAAEQKINSIKRELNKRKRGQADWPHIGDIGYVDEKLDEIMAFLGVQ